MIKNILTITLTAFLLVFAFSATPAQEKGFSKIADIESFKRKMKEQSLLTKTIESSFTQEKYLSFLSEKVVSQGKFYFKMPAQLRWEYTKPFHYMIVINNDAMYIKDDDNENKYDVKSNKMFKEINDILIGCVRGTLLSDKDKFKSSFYENEQFYLTQLIPVSDVIADFLKTINIYFDKSDLTVSKIKMIESSGDYTIIFFNSKKINKNIKDEIFIIH